MLGSFLHLFILLLFSNLSRGIEVKTNSTPEVPTHLSVSQFESIEFHKRVRNDSIHLKLVFDVSELTSSNYGLTWKYRGDDLAIQKEDKRSTVYVDEKYEEESKTLKVTLNLKDSSALPGEYELSVKQDEDTASAKINVNSAPIFAFSKKPKRALQGDLIRLSCKIISNPLPSHVSWSFSPLAMDMSDDRAAITDAFKKLKPLEKAIPELAGLTLNNEDGTPNDTLRIAQLAPTNNGIYACMANNDLGSDTTFILVSVKDRWAALLPFIGIVIEVTILVAAILFYERYQMRAKPVTNENITAVDNTSRNCPPGSEADKNVKADDVRLRNASKA